MHVAGICAVLKQARAAQVIKLSAIKVSHCEFASFVCAYLNGINASAMWLLGTCHVPCLPDDTQLVTVCEGSLCCGLRMLCCPSSVELTLDRRPYGFLVMLSHS